MLLILPIEIIYASFPPMIELYQLRYFLAVVETGSFTKASRRVRVTQPTLSAGIQKLESALSVSLFERSGRRVFLTSAGTRFVARARTILSEVQEAQQELSDVQAKEVLRVGVLTTIAASAVQRLVRDFLRAEANTVLELFEGSERELNGRLESERLDLALTILRPDQRAPAEPLFEEGYALALASHHPLARRASLHVSELAAEPTIVRTRCEVLSETSRFFTGHNVRPRLVYRTEQDERALAMVGAGLGITVMPEHHRWRGVTRIPLVGFVERRKIALIQRPAGARRKPKPSAERFRELASSQAWWKS
jgi:DNA-binding transcriptional LysR family regulator